MAAMARTALLFAAGVSSASAQFYLHESYSTGDCSGTPTITTVQVPETPVPCRWEGVDVYSKTVCVGADYTLKYYNDSACTSPHPSITDFVYGCRNDTSAQAVPEASAIFFNKASCGAMPSSYSPLKVKSYDGPNCTGNETTDTHNLIQNACVNGEGVEQEIVVGAGGVTTPSWVYKPKSSKYEWSGNTFAVKEYYNDKTCTTLSKQELYTCGVCRYESPSRSVIVDCGSSVASQAVSAGLSFGAMVVASILMAIAAF